MSEHGDPLYDARARSTVSNRLRTYRALLDSIGSLPTN
jgi:hypothetical protein